MPNLRDFHPRRILRTPEHFAWVLLQQAICKGLFGIKFLLAARWLGPEMFGYVGVALAALAIVESVSDTGMTQAIIQRSQQLIAREAGAVWTLQMARGLLITLVLLLTSTPIANLFGIPASAPLIMVAAALPFVRNTLNPGYMLLQRNLNFRAVSIAEIIANGFDLGVCMVCLQSGLGPVSVLLGTLAADVCRVCMSWLRFSIRIEVNINWRSIHSLGRFGFWIWVTSILTVLLNQFDKVVVARWLGASSFGIYQASSRLAQLGISDIALAAGQYLFPTMSKMHHENSPEGKIYFRNALFRMAGISGALSAMLATSAEFIVTTLMGKLWLPAVPVLRIQCLAMWIGALIAVAVAYLRAMGRPHLVAQASAIQLLVLVIPSYWVINIYGATGMAWLVCAALATSLAYMVKHSFDGDTQCA